MRSAPRKLASGHGRSSSPARSKLTARSPDIVSASSLAESLSAETAATDHQDDVATQFSLAHELAAAMMPEPSTNSSLAEELGLDFGGADENDDQAEASQGDRVDEYASQRVALLSQDAASADSTIVGDKSSRAHSPIPASDDDYGDDASETESSTPSRPHNPLARTLFSAVKEEEQVLEEPLEQFARELAATDAFITRLKRLDMDISDNSLSPYATATTTFHEPSIERYTSRMIRQLNDTVRERENQVRELVSIDHEFRRIEGELGGTDAIGSLDALDEDDGLFDQSDQSGDAPAGGHLQPLGGIEEEEEEGGNNKNSNTDDSDEDEDVFGEPLSPAKYKRHGRIAVELPPPPVRRQGEIVTPSSTIPHLTHMREVTTSLIQSLSTMSEHAQENGAATADAGRKIRALKNRIVGWQTDLESAEKSQVKIAEWESEAAQSTRIDGRIIVQEQLDAFAKALADAALKTKAIMAS